MSDGAFSTTAREAIYAAGSGRCVGCGRTNITAQHRRGRRMGGTRAVLIGSPANGVPLCGDGVRGCHGWAESHPLHAELMGWRLAPGADAEAAPFWTREGWRRWQIEDDGFPSVLYVDPEDLDRRDLREAAVEAYREAMGR